MKSPDEKVTFVSSNTIAFSLRSDGMSPSGLITE